MNNCFSTIMDLKAIVEGEKVNILGITADIEEIAVLKDENNTLYVFTTKDSKRSFLNNDIYVETKEGEPDGFFLEKPSDRLYIGNSNESMKNAKIEFYSGNIANKSFVLEYNFRGKKGKISHPSTFPDADEKEGMVSYENKTLRLYQIPRQNILLNGKAYPSFFEQLRKAIEKTKDKDMDF